MHAEALEQLKQNLGNQLVSVEQLRPPEGVPTGVEIIDDFLLWKGLPKGELSLFVGKPGTGATSLWLQAAHQVHQQKKWTAWINSDWELLPSSLTNRKINLSRLLVVKKPKESRQFFWILQELITSNLFETIGCHLTEARLQNHQLQKLKRLAQVHKVALVFISSAVGSALHWAKNSLFSLVIQCQSDFFTVKRALHRPTPFNISGGSIYAHLMPQLATASRFFLR